MKTESELSNSLKIVKENLANVKPIKLSLVRDLIEIIELQKGTLLVAWAQNEELKRRLLK